MKLAMLMLTRNEGAGLTLEGQEAEQRFAVTFNRGTLRNLLMLVLVCIAGLATAAWWYAHSGSGVEAKHLVLNGPGGETMIIQTWDRSQPLSRGDRVVLAAAPNGKFQIEQVTATPNQTVVLRRGQNLESLLLLGADKYYVTDAKGSGRVVNAGKIRGIYRGTEHSSRDVARF